MDNTGEVFNKAIKELKTLHGDDFKFEDGDVFVFSLSNCVLILSKEDENFNIEFTGNPVIDLHMSCTMYEEVLKGGAE